MQVLLLKDVSKLGYVGDVVDVKTGYARNYLLPQLLAAAPTPENIAAIEDAKKAAAAERAKRNAEFQKLAERMAEATVTIEAAANPEGTLYGSVGGKEIADALNAQGFEVLPAHIVLESPIRTLDNRVVTLRFTEEISAQAKVWVVREGGAADDDEPNDESEPAESTDDDDSSFIADAPDATE